MKFHFILIDFLKLFTFIEFSEMDVLELTNDFLNYLNNKGS